VRKHRVVVTGIGVVTPIGIGKDLFWSALRARKVGVRPITRFDASAYNSRIAGEVVDFDPTDFVDAKRLRWTERYAQFSIAAARLAMDDARYHVNGDGNDVGVYIGSALGGLAYAEAQSEEFRTKGIEVVRPLLAISVFGGSSVSNVAIAFGLCGPNVANANSCASGTVAVGQAFRAVASGEARAALAGGVEAPLAPLIFGAFTVINAMSRRNDDPAAASRPFDAQRDGFVMAEGAGMLVLERYEDAARRDAPIYAEVKGFGLSNDAYHMSAPRPDGSQVARAMQLALDDAGIAPGDVDCINAHGSSTPLGDRTELEAYGHVFGSRSPDVAVCATKGQHGHALGATGAWEIAVSLLGMQDSILPGAVNLRSTDSKRTINCSANERSLEQRTVLSNSSGFGGINAALVLQRST